MKLPDLGGGPLHSLYESFSIQYSADLERELPRRKKAVPGETLWNNLEKDRT
jgi:hypothetical protein